MGYEVIYQFHPGTGPGEYNKEENQTGSIKVGSPYEDVSLDVLAGRIMALMARRNILVTSVEVFEIVKKSMTFKEVDDGIILKNKKFRFDDGPALTGGEEVSASPGTPAQPEVTALAALLKNPQIAALLSQAQNGNSNLNTTTLARQPHELGKPSLGRPIRYEAFDPDMNMLLASDHAKLPTLKFTKGKKYPIFEEKTAGSDKRAGMLYVTQDDAGNKQVLRDKFFQLQPQLIEDGMSTRQNGLTDAGLSWSGVEAVEAPELRKRR